MKKLFTIALYVLIASPLFAQKNFILSHVDRRGFLNLSGGISMPTASLFSGDPESPSNLMPLQGTSLQVSMGYRLGRRLGLVAQITNCLNESNARTLVDNAERGGLGVNWKAQAGTWNCSHVMLGPTITFSPGRWMFDGRLTGGYSLVQRPSTSLSGEFFNVPMDVQTTSDRSGSFTMGGGVSVRFKLGRNIALALHGDYLSTRATFNKVISTLDMGGDQVSEYIREVKPIGMLSLNGGLSLLF